MYGQFVFLLTTDAELPLYTELWNYFVSVYINNETVYENLNFGGLFSPQTVIIGLFLGLAAACFGSVFTKKINGVLVHRLLSEGCTTPETAKSLPELDLADKLLLRFGVKRGSVIRSVVRCREEEEYIASLSSPSETEAPKKRKKYDSVSFPVDPDAHHFYIPEENMDAVAAKFRKQGNSWGAAVLLAYVILTVMCILIIALPFMLGVLDDFVGMLKG